MFDYSDLIGVPFVDGGRDVLTGLDCWGLTVVVFKRFGISIPDYSVSCEDFASIDDIFSIEKYRARRWLSLTEPKEPCIVALRFNSPIFVNHTGVYIGAGKFIHTAKKTGVRVERINHPYWQHRIEGYYMPASEVKQV